MWPLTYRGNSVALSGFQVIGPHYAGNTILTTGLTCFAQFKKDTRGTLDAMVRRIRRADEAEQSRILHHRSVREGFAHPGIEPAARHVEETAHDGRIKLLTMGFDEVVLQSDRLRSALMSHRPSQISTVTPKVSVKPWEVHIALDGADLSCPGSSVVADHDSRCENLTTRVQISNETRPI